MMVKIGVLGLQGAVSEHVQALQASGAQTSVVKHVEQLDDMDGLVMPGGESTTMRRLIDRYGFFEPLRRFWAAGKPVFGTCAGMILLAKQVDGRDEASLGLMDMKVTRNAFGRQRDSFEAELMIKGVGEDFTGVFIRAPYILEVGENVEILSKYDEKIIAAREQHVLTCSFHPELTDDVRVHQYFVGMVVEAKSTSA